MKKVKKWLMNDIASLEILPSKIRIMILNVCGAKIMASRILPKCYFAGSKLQIGKGTTVNFYNKFDSEYATIIVGENVGIGMNNLFLTTSHKIGGTSLEGFICPQNSDKLQKNKVFGRSGGAR